MRLCLTLLAFLFAGVADAASYMPLGTAPDSWA